ncbi:translation factor Sua5, partial [Acetobacter okinawensis]|uniref:Sua5 family C-terminal domain-containing protein n=1 Tax=Acetobacter okinawensis TaxID=1076594 RepID=UPI001BBE66A2
PHSPGRLISHYAPHLPVRLNALHAQADEALLAFGAPRPTEAPLVWNLSENGNLEEATARLFTGLRTLDHQGRALGLERIAVSPIPQHGLGRAIQDRLNRAAAPRPQDGVEDAAP